ncbi:MAG: DUF4147 domain-containing protein [Thiothrix sp.]|nr:DUF4147 domain-containing protein [Thiothrix sp.]HPQ97179.1 DUF4147 domain-containing protein [Thiolinea sp.]
MNPASLTTGPARNQQLAEAVYRLLMQDGELPSCPVVALGQAAGAMYAGVRRYLEKELQSALLISWQGRFDAELMGNRQLVLREVGQPAPSPSAQQAAATLLRYLGAIPSGSPCLFLLSTGAARLCETTGGVLPALHTRLDQLHCYGLKLQDADWDQPAPDADDWTVLNGRLHWQRINPALEAGLPAFSFERGKPAA